MAATAKRRTAAAVRSRPGAAGPQPYSTFRSRPPADERARRPAYGHPAPIDVRDPFRFAYPRSQDTVQLAKYPCGWYWTVAGLPCAGTANVIQPRTHWP